MIMGPGEASIGKGLREELVRRCEDFGLAVEPEHRGLVETSNGLLEEGANLCTYELELIRAADLAVLIPASAGSLCELGMLALERNVTPKLLIVMNSAYPNNGSFVWDGPVRAAMNGRAIVFHEDYLDVDHIWSLVKAEIQKLRASKLSTRHR